MVIEPKDFQRTSPLEMTSQIVRTPKRARSEAETINTPNIIRLILLKAGFGGIARAISDLLSINLPATMIIKEIIDKSPSVMKDLLITSCAKISQTPNMETPAKITTAAIKKKATTSCIALIKIEITYNVVIL